MEDRFAYGLNPKKLGAVSAYLCDPASAPATQDRNVSTATMRIRARTKGAAMIFKIVRIVHTSYKKFVVCLYMYIITPQEGANKDASAIPTSGQNVQKSR